MKIIAVIAAAVALAIAAAGGVLVALDAAGVTADDAAVTTTDVVATEVIVPGSPNVELDADQEQASVQRPEGVGMHQDARDETPPGVTPEDVERLEESEPAGVGPPRPVGGAELLSCPFQGVRNHSARATGSTVSMVVVHYTVSAPGTLDVIQRLFDTASFAASSHIGLEPSGRCEQWVRYDRKAWTQGAFNSVADSVEIIARGTESREWWLRQPIIRDGLLASWIVDRLRARGLPPRLVDPSGCTPLAGWTDHDRLECGNSHTDVQPNFPYAKVQAQVEALFAPKPATRRVWQVRSGGEVLRQTAARVVDGVSGYDRIVGWMRGAGEAKVRAAEKANGDARIVLRSVPVA